MSLFSKPCIQTPAIFFTEPLNIRYYADFHQNILLKIVIVDYTIYMNVRTYRKICIRSANNILELKKSGRFKSDFFLNLYLQIFHVKQMSSKNYSFYERVLMTFYIEFIGYTVLQIYIIFAYRIVVWKTILRPTYITTQPGI